MKTLGWIFVIIGVLSLFAGGIPLSFEGICVVITPIIIGVILIRKGGNSEE